MVSPSKRRHLRLLVCGLALVVPAFGQSGTMLVEPPKPLLPAQLGDFTKTSATTIGDGIGAIDPAQAAVLKDDGIRRFDHADYTSGSSHASLTAYQFIDASGAFAAFCSSRKGTSASAKPIGENSASGPDGTVFQSGVNLVIAKIDSPQAKASALLEDLIQHLPKVGGPAGQPPLIPTYLPARGLVNGSVRYALGAASYAAMGGVLPADILAFDKSAEAVTAEYAAHRGNGVLTILLYPTPTIAGDEGRVIEAAVHANQTGANPSPGMKTAKLRREGPMLVLASGGFTDAEAQQIVDGIHIHNELTYNKDMPPQFHAEVQKTASLLKSIAIFSGVGAVAAILLGLFLGGARAGIRVLMGKPAASEPEFLRIDLSGKPHELRNHGE